MTFFNDYKENNFVSQKMLLTGTSSTNDTSSSQNNNNHYNKDDDNTSRQLYVPVHEQSWEEIFLHNQVEPNGNFLGHVIPASMYSGVGVLFFVLTVKRLRSLSTTSTAMTTLVVESKDGRKKNKNYSVYSHFCQKHVPENNATGLKVFAYISTIAAVVGIVIEMFSGCTMGYIPPHFCYFRQLGHIALYSFYGVFGIVLLLESNNKLPKDSGRLVLAIGSLASYFLWYDHSQMKTDMSSKALHLNVSRANLLQAVCLVASIFHNQNFTLYITSMSGCFLLIGLALLTAGFHCFVEVPIEVVGPLFCLQIMFVTLFIAVGLTLCSTKNHNATGTQNGYDEMLELKAFTADYDGDESDRDSNFFDEGNG